MPQLRGNEPILGLNSSPEPPTQHAPRSSVL